MCVRLSEALIGVATALRLICVKFHLPAYLHAYMCPVKLLLFFLVVYAMSRSNVVFVVRCTHRRSQPQLLRSMLMIKLICSSYSFAVAAFGCKHLLAFSCAAPVLLGVLVI